MSVVFKYSGGILFSVFNYLKQNNKTLNISTETLPNREFLAQHLPCQLKQLLSQEVLFLCMISVHTWDKLYFIQHFDGIVIGLHF